MSTSYQWNALQNHNRKIANKSFQNVAKFEYAGGTLTNQNLIQFNSIQFMKTSWADQT